MLAPARALCLALATALGACGGEGPAASHAEHGAAQGTAPRPELGAALKSTDLIAALAPRGAEALVLASFWATW